MRREVKRDLEPSSRVLRWAGLDRNPLRRRSDKVEAYATLALVAVFAVVAPVAAWQAGHVAYAAGVQAERVEQAQRYHTEAVLLTGAAAPTFRDQATQVHVPARWTGPDGTPHTARISVDASSRAGTLIPIWVDRDGRVVGPPQRHDETITNAVALAGLVVLALALLLAAIRTLLRRALDRRRLDDWQTDWLRTEPLWNRRPGADPSADPNR